MCFFKKRKEMSNKIDNLQNKVDELTNIIKTQELNRLREESKDYKQTLELLQNVKFKVQSVRVFDDTVRIVYELPKIVLKLDEEGKPNKNEFFYSSNMLNMISIEDMKKIQDAISEAQNNLLDK